MPEKSQLPDEVVDKLFKLDKTLKKTGMKPLSDFEIRRNAKFLMIAKEVGFPLQSANVDLQKPNQIPGPAQVAPRRVEEFVGNHPNPHGSNRIPALPIAPGTQTNLNFRRGKGVGRLGRA